MKIYHANIVTPEKVIENGTVAWDGDTITELTEGEPSIIGSDAIDAQGGWVIPGIIDSHSDAIEIELEPRPTSRFPLALSFFELEKKLANQGITTIYHSLSLMNHSAIRRSRKDGDALDLIEQMHRLSNERRLIRHKTHLRYELANTDPDTVDHVTRLIKAHKINEFSLMDHTPGQGQYRDLEVEKRLLVDHRHYSEEEADAIIREAKAESKLDDQVIRSLIHLAIENGIAVASHDDDTIEKVKLIHDWHCSISEFPITLEAAAYAKDLGLFVVMGAPNLLLGKSHSNNLSAKQAIEKGLVDMLCSDYYPSSMLHAIFSLRDHLGLTMPQAVNMVTLNPARALNLDQLGSIEVGKKADLLIIEELAQQPILHHVIVGGKQVVALNYHTPYPVHQLLK